MDRQPTSPVTSDHAALQLPRWGCCSKQTIAVYQALSRNPGVTGPELAAIMDVAPCVTSGSLPLLERLGRARKGTTRFCAASKRECVTWEIVP